MSLCADCLQRRAKDKGEYGLVARGGWVAPSGVLLDDFTGDCYEVVSLPFDSFLPSGKKIKRKRALKAFRKWQRNEAMVGQMIHGYVRMSDLFPEVSVSRGGITYNTPKEKA